MAAFLSSVLPPSVLPVFPLFSLLSLLPGSLSALPVLAGLLLPSSGFWAGAEELSPSAMPSLVSLTVEITYSLR